MHRASEESQTEVPCMCVGGCCVEGVRASGGVDNGMRVGGVEATSNRVHTERAL
eukprot:m.430329 g.430329  ORF g.430329 m.430329 type:complete len:54 (-) comp78754_c0_seq1:272-433(-)